VSESYRLDLFALENGVDRLQEGPVADGAFELSPTPAVGMSIGTNVAQPHPAVKRRPDDDQIADKQPQRRYNRWCRVVKYMLSFRFWSFYREGV